MNQFKSVFLFEFRGYLKSKAFRITTIAIGALLLLALTIPPIISNLMSGSDSGPAPDPSERPVILIVDPDGLFGDLTAVSAAFPEYNLEKASGPPGGTQEYKNKIGTEDGEYEAVLLVRDSLHFTIIEKDPTMSALSGRFTDFAELSRRQGAMAKAGMDAASIADAYKTVEIEGIGTGKDYWTGYSQTYVMLMLLYMSVMLYGQFVAASVANEKSSRAMELLITSAKTENLIFGKIFGIGCAGFFQLVVWIACILGGYMVSRDFWSGIPFLSSALNMPLSTVLFALMFYIIGFFMYASMYGAIGSLVSRQEDINTVATPVMMLILASFFSAIFAITMPDSIFAQVMSLVPFSAPMVMFVRVSMGEVHPLIITLSVLLSAGTTVLIALLSSAIYRVGVIMYGKPPRIGEVIRSLRASKKY